MKREKGPRAKIIGQVSLLVSGLADVSNKHGHEIFYSHIELQNEILWILDFSWDHSLHSSTAKCSAMMLGTSAEWTLHNSKKWKTYLIDNAFGSRPNKLQNNNPSEGILKDWFVIGRSKKTQPSRKWPFNNGPCKQESDMQDIHM